MWAALLANAASPWETLGSFYLSLGVQFEVVRDQIPERPSCGSPLFRPDGKICSALRSSPSPWPLLGFLAVAISSTFQPSCRIAVPDV
jgi:hypothetical protein